MEFDSLNSKLDRSAQNYARNIEAIDSFTTVIETIKRRRYNTRQKLRLIRSYERFRYKQIKWTEVEYEYFCYALDEYEYKYSVYCSDQ